MRYREPMSHMTAQRGWRSSSSDLWVQIVGLACQTRHLSATARTSIRVVMPHNMQGGRNHVAKCADPGANTKPSIPVYRLVPRIPVVRHARLRWAEPGRMCCE